MMKKRFLSMLLVFVMVLTMIPMTVLATESEKVYISISDEGQFIEDLSGNPMAYRAVELDALNSIDLDEYGFSDYKYDEDGDGNYEITALHLFIYVHEQILGLDFNDVDASNGSPLSMYFSSGLFGFEDENLRYDYNGAYPANEDGWGYTADWIVLSSGDYFNVAHYSDWQFYYDSAYGFNYFANESGEIVHEFTAEAGTPMDAKVVLVNGGMGIPNSTIEQVGYTAYYGQSIGNAMGTVETNDDGVANITFPSAGIWYIWCDGGEGIDMCPGSIVSSPASAKIIVTATEEEPNIPKEPEVPREPQDVSDVLNATMAQLAATVAEPSFGTNAGEWTVLSLARGEYFDTDNSYFKGYYDRIVETVNELATKYSDAKYDSDAYQVIDGALHNKKSTENSRLIVALSSIGKDATTVGNWNLLAPYDDFGWIKNQGTNGIVWALLALDSNNYQTQDTTIRQQCIDELLSLELETGGWPLAGGVFDNDITGMTIQALYPYKDQPEVAAAVERAFNYLSEIQLETGGFNYGSSETSESSAQIIVACTTWGINPDTDSRFIKSGNSVVDNLLTYYIEEEAMFAHQGNVSNNMATDQACYALVAYNRFLNGKTALYDYSDVTFEEKPEIIPGKPVASLGFPEKITNELGQTFNATISLDRWDNEAGYKMIDFILNVPEGLSVTDVVAEGCLNGGEVSYSLEAETGKLRVVYFDSKEHKDLTVNNASFPTPVFTITLRVDGVTDEGYIGTENTVAVLSNDGYQRLNIALSGMSIKRTSDSTDEDAMVVVDSGNAVASIIVVQGLAYSVVCLYTGDNVDLIPSGKKAVAVAVVGCGEEMNKLIYDDETNKYELKYSDQITKATNIPTYVALVDSSIEMEQFALKTNFVMTEETASEVTFGDANGDGVINAQDALVAVDTWLRKTETPSDDDMLALNVNGDSRINTFDALGVVEAFVDGSEYIIVTKAKSLNNTTE